MPDSWGTFSTRVGRVTRVSASLRTTIPQVIAEILKLTPGSVLVWSVDAAGTGVRVARAQLAAVPHPSRVPATRNGTANPRGFLRNTVAPPLG